jgi:hypothetical protein
VTEPREGSQRGLPVLLTPRAVGSSTTRSVRRHSGPGTLGGRVIAIVVMVVGIGLVAIVTAAAAERFMRGREAEAERAELRERLDEVLRRLDELESPR